jgi:hypothetical protein
MKKLLAILCVAVFLGGCSTPAELYETNTNNTEGALSSTVTSPITVASSYTEAPSTTVKPNATEPTVTEKIPTTTAKSTLAVTSAIVEPPNEPLVADISARIREPINNPNFTNNEQSSNSPLGSPISVDTFDEVIQFICNPDNGQLNADGNPVDQGLFRSFIEGFGGRGYILEPRINGLPVKLERFDVTYGCGTVEVGYPIGMLFEMRLESPKYSVRIPIDGTRVHLAVSYLDDVYLRTASRDPIRFWGGKDRLKFSTSLTSEVDRNAIGSIVTVARERRVVDDISRSDLEQLLFVHDGYLISLHIFINADTNINIWQVAEMLSFERLPIR